MIKWVLAAAALFGVYVILHFVVYNGIRGDEFLSFLHSDPEWESIGVVTSHIHSGADNSYTHAALLYIAFSFFGHSMVVQRMLSMAFWFIGMFLVRELLRKEIDNRLQVWLTTFMIGFSNFGIYLAADGRFYSILFCLAAGMMLLYANRTQLKPVWYFAFLLLIQLAGLLTSSNYMVLQGLFVLALIIQFRLIKQPDENRTVLLSISATILSSCIYFLFFKIAYFHSFFVTNLFSAKPFNGQMLNELISAPFRWIMMPHIPPLSDAIDVIVFCVLLGIMLIKRRQKLIPEFRDKSWSYKTLGIITALLLFFMLLQVVAMFTLDFPLWPVRYYTSVFFIAGIILSGLVLSTTDTRVAALLLLAFCLRLVWVEFPKIETRKAEQDQLSIEELGWKHENKPIIFIETETDYSVFSIFGNMYINNLPIKDRLRLKYNEKDTARANYFRQLEAFHYPLQFVHEMDSGNQIVVTPQHFQENK